MSKQRGNRFQLGFSRLFNRRGKRGIRLFTIDKRQKFVVAVIVLSLSLFLSEFQNFHITHSGIYVVFLLSVLTNIFLYWAIHDDVKENKSYQSFILPFFYSLAFGLFYF